MAHLGRLPPLQAIGRSQCVDLEEPPDLSDTEIDQFLDEYNNADASYKFDPDHAESAVTGLGNHFRVLYPGEHMCKKIPESATGFTHTKNSLYFSVKYAELRHMLQTQAQLHFVRDYASRINAASMFVKDIEAVVQEEYAMWYNICHNSLTSAPVTKLECLNSICEDLRVHMNHWSSVKQMLFTDPWLRTLMPSLVLDLDRIRTRLFQLRDCAIWWIDRLVQVGFRVLAHGDLDRISGDSLWSIMRGLEEFNSIVSAVKYDKVIEMNHPGDVHLNLSSPHAVFNSYKNIGETVKTVPFARVLNLVANERSRYAAAITHQFFTSSRELLHLAFSSKGLADYMWADEIMTNHKKRSSKSVDTSDYHTATGSHISLGTAMLKVGGITAPDLSHEASPLMDFARREKTFAQKFLQIVCHSTKLLKRPVGPAATTTSNRSSFKKKPHLADTHTGTPTLPPKGNNSRRDPDGPEMNKKHEKLNNNPPLPTNDDGTLAPTRTDPKRKSVSWGDAAEVTIIQQLSQRYMDLLWQYFNTSLMEQFTHMVWGGPEEVRGQLGSTIVTSDLILQLVIRMMQQTCAKDMFPLGATTSMSQVAEKLHVVAAWRAWDKALCSSLASAAVDKCHPVLLVDNEHSSNTARKLRDAFHPLQSALCLLLTTHQGGSGSRALTLALSVPTAQRLVMTCEASERWCTTRGELYLNTWALGAFLLVTQSDIKILGDEVRKAVANCQALCVNPDYNDAGHNAKPASRGSGKAIKSSTSTEKSHLDDTCIMIEELSTQLQSLSGTLIKQFSEKCHRQAVEYFDDEMPVGKIWRRRQFPENPIEPSPYVEHALDSLLEPIIAGANKLAVTSQLSVVSMATTAMCEAWTEVILQRKIKFSVIGAQQLEEDFRMVQTWLETYIQNPQVKLSILSLDIFKYLTAIVDLLKRQPKPRSASRPPERRVRSEEKSSGTQKPGRRMIGLQINVGEGKAQRQRHYEAPSSCDVSVSTGSSDQWQDGTAPPTSDSSYSGSDPADKHSFSPNAVNHNTENGGTKEDDAHHFKIPKMEQWLALRVHGGARNWPKLPSCFNNTHS